MNKTKSLYEMDDSELADVLYFEPERFDEVIVMLINEDEISRLGKIAEFLRAELVPEEELGDYLNNKGIRETLSRIDEYGDIIYREDDEFNMAGEEYLDFDEEEGEIIPEEMTEEERARLIEEYSDFDGEYDILMEGTDKELEDFYEQHPELDDRPESPIPEGMSPEEYSEVMEGEEIIRSEDSLKGRKVLVSEVEELAKNTPKQIREGALNEVTNPKEKIKKGPTHED